MDLNEQLLSQQSINKEDFHEQVKEIPECSTEIVNTQEILQNKEAQVEQEIFITAEEELQDIQLTKRTEHDAVTLRCILQFETELLAKTKAKEEVKACSLQSHIQELQENKRQLDDDIVKLQAFKEQLERNLTAEKLRRSHNETLLKNTGKMVNMLNENYKGLKQTYQTALGETSKLEQNYETNLKDYQGKKEKLLEVIKIQNENLEKLKANNEAKDKQFRADMEVKNNNLKKLKDEEAKVANDIANMKKKCENLKNELVKNKKTLADVEAKNQGLRNLINGTNLEELEAQKIEKQQGYQNTLNAMKIELDIVKKSYEAAENCHANLLKSLEKETNIGNELEETYDKLENEHGALIAKREELNKVDKLIEDKTANICLLKSKIEETDRNLINNNKEIAETCNRKTEAITELNIVHNKHAELEAKLAEMHSQSKILIEDDKLNQHKLSELQQRISDTENEIKNVFSELVDVKEKYSKAEQKFNQELEKSDKELAHAKMMLEKLRLESNTRTRALQEDLLAYKSETEKTVKHNRENNQQKLADMKEQLNTLKSQLEKENKDLEQTKNSVERKRLTHQKLQLEFALANVTPPQEYSQTREVVLKNIKPPSILKSPGKSPTSKTVSWRVPTNSSFDSENSQVEVVRKTTDELFDELFRMSPPERLDEGKGNKRPRID